MHVFPRYVGPPLLTQTCTVENLTRAWRRVERNIQWARRDISAGVDAMTLRDFQADWTNQMTILAGELLDGSYRPLPPLQFTIPKKSGGERALALLAVRDRVAQRAVQQVLGPVFEPLFLDCSFGCRPHVAVPEAVERVRRYADQGLTWVVDADIARCFDAIDQRLLLHLVRQRVAEEPVLALLAQWLAAGTLHAPEGAAMLGAGGAVAGTGPSALWARGKSAVGQLTHRGAAAARDAEPYQAEPGWGTGHDAYGEGLFSPTPDAWQVAALARPVLDGARVALPHLRRLGGRRLLVAGAVAAGALAAGELAARHWPNRPRGTAQGSPLSPLLANIYLHSFDLGLTGQGLRLVRYMDDFVIMCASEDDARQALRIAEQRLAKLRLAVNPTKTRLVAYADGLEFLGQALAPRQRGPVLEQGAATFGEAEAALRRAARQAQLHLRRPRRAETTTTATKPATMTGQGTTEAGAMSARRSFWGRYDGNTLRAGTGRDGAEAGERDRGDQGGEDVAGGAGHAG